MYKLKIEENELKVPVVEFKLGDGTLHKALLDTGSMISIIDISLPTENKEKRKIEISTLNGVEQKSIAKANINIELAEKTVCITGAQLNLKEILSDLDVDMIIGSESLYEMGAVIDMDNNELIIQ